MIFHFYICHIKTRYLFIYLYISIIKNLLFKPFSQSKSSTLTSFFLFCLGVITSLIISYLFFSSSLSGVIWRLLKEKLILWSWQSSLISPWSSLDTAIVLSFLLNLKLQGLQRQDIEFGFISISFLNCILPSHNGQLITIFLLINLCSSVNVMVLGSKSSFISSSSSSSIIGGCFFTLFFLLILYIILQIIYKYFG